MKNLITSRLTAFLCAAVMVLGLTACGAKITGLSLPASAVLEKGETLQMDLRYDTEPQTDADALAEAAEKLELVWTSDDETVASVDENGLVTAVGAGETTIRVSARDGELSGSCVVTVVVTARDLVVPDTLELVLNGQNSANLNASATPEDATGVTFTYTSSDESVATVDETGLVTAVANGEADITVTLTQTFPAATGETATAETYRQPVTLTATTHVTVTTAAERIELDKTEGVLTVGSTHKIRAAVLPDTATDQIPDLDLQRRERRHRGRERQGHGQKGRQHRYHRVLRGSQRPVQADGAERQVQLLRQDRTHQFRLPGEGCRSGRRGCCRTGCGRAGGTAAGPAGTGCPGERRVFRPRPQSRRLPELSACCGLDPG